MTAEIRANDLQVGDVYAEPGMEGLRVHSLQYHGDTVLVTGPNDEQDALDIDTVVLLLDREGVA